MSAAADKARYFLEQSVPELKELERKKIFTPEEITTLAKKRSDFEHKINARGSSPSDYAQYAEFEINVDQLRKKRVKRLGVRLTTHNGQRRVFFVFDRGMRKFPGDLKLWVQSIEYARSQKALKKVQQILTNALRLHPTKAELWIYAAQFALDENGDMTEARGYMQRGLRFCKNNKQLWLQNFRLELSWIAKIHARRRILGMEDDGRKKEDEKIVGGDDMIMLPKVTAEDVVPELGREDNVDVTALAKLDSTPIMTGAIPIAIFDATMEQFQNDPSLALRMFEEVASFADVPALASIAQHIDATLQASNPTTWQASACHINQTTWGVKSNSPKFPSAIRDALAGMTRELAATEQRPDLVIWCRKYLEALLQDDLDLAIEKILRSKLHSLA